MEISFWIAAILGGLVGIGFIGLTLLAALSGFFATERSYVHGLLSSAVALLGSALVIISWWYSHHPLAIVMYAAVTGLCIDSAIRNLSAPFLHDTTHTTTPDSATPAE